MRLGTKTQDHLGNEFQNFTVMCKHYGHFPYTITYRMEHGMSLEQALTTPSRGKIVYNGKTFKNINDLCKQLKIKKHYTCIVKRLRNGMSLEEAITNTKRFHHIINFNGETYPNRKDACQKLGISLYKLKRMMNQGFDAVESLSIILEEKKGVQIGDQWFATTQDICDHFGLALGTVRKNIKCSTDPEVRLILMQKSQRYKHSSK